MLPTDSLNFSKLRFIGDTVRPYWSDLLISSFLAVLAGLVSYHGAYLIDTAVLIERNSHDLWFDADIPLVFGNLTTRQGARSEVHPLFPLLGYPPVFVLRSLFNLEPIAAVRIVVAAIAAVWGSCIFGLLRLMGCRHFDAAVFSTLAIVSAGARFWFTIPETYSFGSLTIVFGLCLAAAAQHRRFSPLWFILVSGLTLSITVTNWMVGIAATIVHHAWRRSLQITAIALVLVFALRVPQQLIFADSSFLLHTSGESKYISFPDLTDLIEKFRALIFHSMIMPAIQIVGREANPFGPSIQITTVQHSTPGSGTPWGLVAVLLWAALLGLGLWALISLKQQTHLRVVLALALLGQFALHALYGSETFLYSLNLVPLLLPLAALSVLTRTRPIALTLACVLVICVGINNAMLFQQAVAFVNQGLTP